ncbi:unannotated protein [freshwater metagenome]|uniref:Unannotated protein n=1 Tax=freshwater metagenome TaxID=449393 RepID=A0A6J7GPD0_9ZZZZ
MYAPTSLAFAYASGVNTSVSTARAAAIVKGLPLNVPTWLYRPSVIADMTSVVPPTAPHGNPPPSAFARQMMSGVIPYIAVTPPG